MVLCWIRQRFEVDFNGLVKAELLKGNHSTPTPNRNNFGANKPHYGFDCNQQVLYGFSSEIVRIDSKMSRAVDKRIVAFIQIHDTKVPCSWRIMTK